MSSLSEVPSTPTSSTSPLLRIFRSHSLLSGASSSDRMKDIHAANHLSVSSGGGGVGGTAIGTYFNSPEMKPPGSMNKRRAFSEDNNNSSNSPTVAQSFGGAIRGGVGKVFQIASNLRHHQNSTDSTTTSTATIMQVMKAYH